MLRRQLRYIVAIAVTVAISLLIAAQHRAGQQGGTGQQAATQGAPGAGAPEGGGGGPGGPPSGPPPPPAVTVVTLEPQDVTLLATLPGRVVASAFAEVRPQVDGIITERTFEEGEPVTLGDPLYRIDDATYAAAVAAARASVAQAQASFDAAVKTADRQIRLQGRGVVSEQEQETATATRDQAAAQLQVAQANLLAAEIDLARTTISAPLTGIIGRSLTTRGALVTAGQAAPLAVVRTIDPVLVDVTQSAAELIEFRRGQTEKKLANADLSVSLILADGSTYPVEGTLTAAEPYVSEETGVVTLRLEFPNPDEILLPGMYVEVEMPQGVAKGAILAPQEGVSRDRRGNPVAFVVNAQNVVEQRDLTIARARGADWIVTAGLTRGDRIVVEGVQKVAPGAPVQPEERKPAPAPAVEELDAPTEAARSEEAAGRPPTGETVPGSGDAAPPPTPDAGGGGGAGAAADGGGAEAASGASPNTAGDAPADPSRARARG